MRAVVVLAGVADGILVDITEAEHKALKAMMRPSRKQHTIDVTKADGGTVTLAGDMICAIHVPAAAAKARRR
jgi:hypothetical protein